MLFEALFNLDKYLTHHWPLTSSSMKDFIGSADMTQGNLTKFTSDRFGNPNSALALNGGWTQVPSGIYFDTPEFTISAWIYPQNLSVASRFVNFGNPGGNPFDTIEFVLNDPNPFLAISQGSDRLNYPMSSIPLTLNQWQFLVGTYDGFTLSIYINGKLVASKTMNYILPTLNRTQTWFGKSSYSSNGFSYTYLDDIRFFNVSLNQADINQLMYPPEKSNNFIV